MKKIMFTALFIAAVAFIPVSCGDSGAADGTGLDAGSSDAENNANETEETVPAIIEPDLPERDFGGYTFTFLAHRIGYAGDWVGDEAPRELVAEEEDGEPINDAVYRRNMKIKEQYNIEIEMSPTGDERNTLTRAVSAGDDLYDAVVIFNNNVSGVITSDLLVNISSLPFIDTSKPWWDSAANAMSIDNKNYLLSGDLLILDNEATNALLFNKELLADLAVDLPYSLVYEGKWTMDKLHETVRGTAADLDGDGAMGQADRWGFSVFNDTLHALLVGGGGSFAVKDDDDIPYMDFASPKNLAVLNKAMDLMYNREYTSNHQAGGVESRTAFEENRIVFLWGRVHLVSYFKGMESNFGIVPLPKYDENQENYHSLVNPYTGVMMGVPKSVTDLERASIILEALSAESGNTLQPAYYDVVLQRKYVRDDESSDMLDIIFGSRVYDVGGMYGFGNIFIDFNTVASQYNRDITSYYERRIGVMESDINKVVEIFRSME